MSGGSGLLPNRTCRKLSVGDAALFPPNGGLNERFEDVPHEDGVLANVKSGEVEKEETHKKWRWAERRARKRFDADQEREGANQFPN